jgi:hypothetical protein
MSTDASSPLHCFQTVWGPGNRLGAGPPRDPPAALALGKAGGEAGRVGMFSTAPEPPSRAPQWQELQGSVYAQVFSLHGVRISAILCESVSACFFVRSAICPFPPPKTRIHTFAVCAEGGNFAECSSKVGSSSGARQLFTRFDTGHFCSTSTPVRFISAPASSTSPCSHSLNLSTRG